MHVQVYNVCSSVHTTVHVCRSEDSFQELVLSFHPAGPGTELRLPDFTASSFTHCIILPTQHWVFNNCPGLHFPRASPLLSSGQCKEYRDAVNSPVLPCSMRAFLGLGPSSSSVTERGGAPVEDAEERKSPRPFLLLGRQSV